MEQSGDAARASIALHDPLPPNTFIVVPDSLLLSSTRAVESVLNELKNEGLLTYTLVDSGIQKRTLSRPDFEPQPDSLVFYHYTLQWDNKLDAFHVQAAKQEQVWDMKLFGKQYNAEFRFNARHLRAGPLTFPNRNDMYFRQTCDSIFIRYTYAIDSVLPLARMAGMPAFIKAERIVNMRFVQ